MKIICKNKVTTESSKLSVYTVNMSFPLWIPFSILLVSHSLLFSMMWWMLLLRNHASNGLSGSERGLRVIFG